jgi:hypothetical protein
MKSGMEDRQFTQLSSTKLRWLCRQSNATATTTATGTAAAAGAAGAVGAAESNCTNKSQ